MRYGLFLLLVLPACNTDLADPPEAPPASMRDRLADLTHLQVVAGESGGAITAERKIAGGWSAGVVDLAIENGELLVSSDAPDAVTLEGFQVVFAPLQLPAGTFGDQDAKLEHVRFELATATRAPAVWTGDGQVTLTADLDIDLAWTLTLDGSPTPLGSPDLPPVPVELVLTGDGEHVRAELRANAPGELWNWAGLIKLSELSLAIGADLTDR